MSLLKTIGVIGGMGPAATVQFMDRVIALTKAQDDIDHVPMFVDQNPQIPSRIKALIEGKGDDPVPVIIEMARRLEERGCDALAMPCNTAHYYAGQIARAVNIPFLNMIRISAEFIHGHVGPGARIGMLASPATDQLKVFQSEFDRFNMKAVFPRDANGVLSLIRRIKSDGITDEIIDGVQALADALITRGADALLIGCSEFSMLAGSINSPLPRWDSVDLLAGAVIDFSGAVRR